MGEAGEVPGRGQEKRRKEGCDALCIRSLAACLGIGLGEKGVGEERERGESVCSFTRAFSTSLPLQNFPSLELPSLGQLHCKCASVERLFFWSSTAFLSGTPLHPPCLLLP